LTWGLTNFDTIKIAEINKEISRLQVWLGNKNEVQVYVKEDIYKTIPKARKKYLKAYIQYDGPILAPIKKNQKVGVLKIIKFKNL
jgi:D-alanyl-D-alanine carboxypeptidase (penicillin-binding protein 5/6)